MEDDPEYQEAKKYLIDFFSRGITGPYDADRFEIDLRYHIIEKDEVIGMAKYYRKVVDGQIQD